MALSMKNNPFYLISDQYKLDQRKERERKQAAKLEKARPKCKICEIESPYYSCGDFKGWCKSCVHLDNWFYQWMIDSM